MEAIAGILSKVDAADPLKPVVDNVANGNILGFAGVVGCSSIKFRDGEMTERMVMELLANNVLVVTTGCTAHICAQDGLLTSEATEKYCGDGLKAVLPRIGPGGGARGTAAARVAHGLLRGQPRDRRSLAAVAGRLGVKVSQLPAIGSAPELVQEKALSIGVSFLALGMAVHVAPAPRILGGPRHADADPRPGGHHGRKVFVEYDPIKAAADMVAHIKEKRAALGLS